jgi:DNA-binding transcriptional MerR regulator
MMLNITETASALGCHPDTLRRLEREGLFQARRDRRGARRYTPQDIDCLRDVLYQAEPAHPAGSTPAAQ